MSQETPSQEELDKMHGEALIEDEKINTSKQVTDSKKAEDMAYAEQPYREEADRAKEILTNEDIEGIKAQAKKAGDERGGLYEMQKENLRKFFKDNIEHICNPDRFYFKEGEQQEFKVFGYPNGVDSKSLMEGIATLSKGEVTANGEKVVSQSIDGMSYYEFSYPVNGDRVGIVKRVATSKDTSGLQHLSFRPPDSLNSLSSESKK